MRHKHHYCACLVLLLVIAPGAWSEANDTGLEAVKEYLKKNHAMKKWQSGPTLLTTDEIKKAYGNEQKFYFVFSAPPLPPGANLPELIRAYEARFKDYRDNYLSATLRMDARNGITPLNKAADYNEGLMPVKNEDDAKTAAAAILSLFGSGKVSPGAIRSAEVTVTRTDQGWHALVNRRNQFQGSVDINNKGQVTRLSKVFTGPLPP